MKSQHLLSVYKDADDELNKFKYYAHQFGSFPNFVHIDHVRGLDFIEALQAPHPAHIRDVIKERVYSPFDFRRRASQKVVTFDTGEMFCATENSIEYYYTEEKLFHEDRLVEESAHYALKQGERKPRIQLIVPSRSGLRLQFFDCDTKPTNIALHYNEDMPAYHEDFVRKLNNKKLCGLHFLYGHPGTGKTHFLRHVITQMEKDVIYIPSGMAEVLSDPAFLQLLLEARGDVLIIEDAEKAIVSRDTNHNNAVSTLLNISDGLLSDVLNMQIVCTFNTELHNVDRALLRPGRLLSKYEFRPLEAQRAGRLCASLGYNREVSQPLTLAEIYAGQDTKVVSLKAKKAVGF